MGAMEAGKRYSAKKKGYNDKIYEVRFVDVMERPEYKEGPVRTALEKLQQSMNEKDFEKYINSSLIRITYDAGRLLLITNSEMNRTMLYGRFFNLICEAFDVGNFRVVSQVNGY